MSQGKFSNPRPHREEEREIEKAYRDLTRKNNPTARRSQRRRLPFRRTHSPWKKSLPRFRLRICRQRKKHPWIR